jgi:hypothetical protein
MIDHREKLLIEDYSFSDLPVAVGIDLQVSDGQLDTLHVLSERGRGEAIKSQ